MKLTNEQIAALTKKRWVLLVICCLINLCIGSMYAWSVLAAPMAQELNVPSLSIVFSVANALGLSLIHISTAICSHTRPSA